MTAKIKKKPASPPPKSDPEIPKNKRDRRDASQRRADRREELWPGSSGEVWTRHGSVGFATIPRLLPLITVLMRELSKHGDPSSVYMELWSRIYDEGYVQIKSEVDHAYASGYDGIRAVRTWSERMDLLEEQGFIKVKPNGAQKYGHILILDPLLVAARLRKKLSSRVPDAWWTAFRSRADEIGADVPSV